MTAHEQALLIGDTVALLQHIVARKGEAQHVDKLPGCFNAKMWASTERLFVGDTVGRNIFCFYLTQKGLRFLQENGVSTDGIKEVRSYVAEAPLEPVEVTAVFVQNRNESIEQVELESVPGFVIQSLRSGMLAVADSKLYGLSPEHILGT